MRVSPRALSLLLLMGVGSLAATTLVYAHAIVLKSSLATRPVKRGVADSITLHFNSRIEVKLSRAVLLRGDRSEQALLLDANGSPGDVVIKLPALEAGDYAIRYRVLAADGHVTEETLRFSVAP